LSPRALNLPKKFIPPPTPSACGVSDNAQADLVYIGTGTWLSGSGTRTSFENVNAVSGSTGTFVNVQNMTLNMTAADMVNWANLGTMTASAFGKGIYRHQSIHLSFN